VRWLVLVHTLRNHGVADMIKDNAILVWAVCTLYVLLYVYVHPDMLSAGVWLP